MTTIKLAERYSQLSGDRQPYLDRARACAALTLPSVCPPMGQSPSNALPQAFQSFGARAVTNLGAKLLMALLPPGTSSFNLKASIKALMKQGTLTPPPDVTDGLAKCEMLINEKIELLHWRRPTYTTLVHLIVTGNMAEYITPEGRIKQFRLDQFVCVRNWDGKVIEVVTAETMKVRALPEALKNRTDKKEDSDATLYTRFVRNDENSYSVRQDLDNEPVSNEVNYTGIMPCNALAWDIVPGENYGRSHVEYNYPDLLALDAVSKQLLDAGALASRNLIFVSPNAAGGNLRKRITEARNGAVLSGRGGPNGDVQPFQFNNSGSIQTMQAEKQDLQRGLAQSFLLTSDLRRDAERVTAYELQMLASEIEQGLGGTYSLLAVELQAWRIKKLMAIMQKASELPDLADQVSVEVTTGLEALGKDAQVNKARSLFQLFSEVPQAFQAEAAMRIDFNNILTPTVAAIGFPDGVKSESQVSQEQQAQAQQALQQSVVDKGTAPMINAASAAQAQGQ